MMIRSIRVNFIQKNLWILEFCNRLSVFGFARLPIPHLPQHQPVRGSGHAGDSAVFLGEHARNFIRGEFPESDLS